MSQYEEWLERELDLLEPHYDGKFNREDVREWLEGTVSANIRRATSNFHEQVTKQHSIYRWMLKLARYINRKMQA